MEVLREVGLLARRCGVAAALDASPLRSMTDAARHILANAASMIGTMAVTSALGFVYWWVAARHFSPASVGFAAAAVSAMTLFGTLGVLGLGTVLMGELPKRRSEPGTLVVTAMLASGAAGAALGLAGALILPRISNNLNGLADSFGSMLVFAAGAGLTAMSSVLDQALIGLLKGGLQLGRNTAFAIVKLVALVGAGMVIGSRSGMAIYATWLAGIVVSFALLVPVALRRGHGLQAYRPRWRLLRGLSLAALGHHALNLGLQTPTLALPIVVTLMLSATANAYFYVASMLLSFLAFVPFALTLALYAVGAADPEALADKMRFTLRLAFLSALGANAILMVGAVPVLSIFGSLYARNAAWTLRILGLGMFPLIVKDHYVAICRIRARLVGAAAWIAVCGLLELTLAALGARLGGLVGLSVGFVVALCIEAARMAPVLYTALVPEVRKTVVANT